MPFSISALLGPHLLCETAESHLTHARAAGDQLVELALYIQRNRIYTESLTNFSDSAHDNIYVNVLWNTSICNELQNRLTYIVGPTENQNRPPEKTGCPI